MFETFLEFLGWAALGLGAGVVVLIVLLAIPGNPMRNWLTTLVMRLLATGVAGAYALSPIDIIPDFIPVLGQLDDVTVLVLLLYYWWAMLNPAKPGAPHPYAARPSGGGRGGQVIDIQADEIR